MKKARALRTIRRLKAAETSLSGWEGEFLDSVETRLGTEPADTPPRKGLTRRKPFGNRPRGT